MNVPYRRSPWHVYLPMGGKHYGFSGRDNARTELTIFGKESHLVCAFKVRQSVIKGGR